MNDSSLSNFLNITIRKTYILKINNLWQFYSITAFSNGQGPPPEEKDFIDASRLVYEGVREIRTAVLLNRNSMEFDSDDTEIDTEIASTIDSRAGSTLPIVTGHLGT